MLLPRPASHFCCATVSFPCVEAPMGEATVLSTAAGVVAHGVRWSSCAGKGWRGWVGVCCENKRRTAPPPPPLAVIA